MFFLSILMLDVKALEKSKKFQTVGQKMHLKMSFG